MKISEKFKKVMKTKRITEQDIADNLNISKKTVSNTFYNEAHGNPRGMTIDTMMKYADVLGCDVIIRDRETGEEY